jgi:polyhydroxyalkanoate synthesis regulator phasin
LIQQAQQETVKSAETEKTPSNEPRRIEILSDDEAPTEAQNNVDVLRKQVQAMQDELRRLKRD